MSVSQREKHLAKFGNVLLSMSNNEGHDFTSITYLSHDPSISATLSVQLESFVSNVHIPMNYIEGILNKAANIRKTKDAIVPAPGVKNGKFVLSYRGTNPHLVVAKTSTVFACNADCPNWKGLGICAHSVAVAELSNILPEFNEKPKKAKRDPNLTHLADVTLPKGRGRKGGQQPQKRQRN